MSAEHEFPAELVETVARAMWNARWPDAPWDADEYEGSPACRHDALAALRALRDAGALVGPDQVAVPRDATKEMITAALDRPPEHEGEMMYGGIYRAMLAAAPRAGGGDE